MPIDDAEWKEARPRNQKTPSGGAAGLTSDIVRFLETHADQAFTLSEIVESVEFVSAGSNADGVRGRVADVVRQLTKKRVVEYYCNKLVAEGYVDTRTRVTGETETLYYRWYDH